MANILQADVMVNFVYPFLLVFFLLFAIFEKTKIFGEGKKTISAMISLVLALVFVSAVFPKMVVANLMLFLVVGLVVIFVGLVMWGFLSGNAKGEWTIGTTTSKWLGALLIVIIVVAILWIVGAGNNLQGIFDFLFGSKNSGVFWTNFFIVAFVVVIVAQSFSAAGYFLGSFGGGYWWRANFDVIIIVVLVLGGIVAMISPKLPKSKANDSPFVGALTQALGGENK
jgi:heme/copper-type cytochrome/quinol oxidase subunit 4